MVRRLVRKVISTCTKSRTSLLMRQLMSLRAASRRIHCRELATPPPADQTDNRSDTGRYECHHEQRGAGWPVENWQERTREGDCLAKGIGG